MYRASASPRTIKNVPFCLVRRMDALLAVCSFLCQFFQAFHDNSSTYICLANHSAVSKPHPTEGAETYTGCRIPRCYKVCWALCTPLGAGRCARCSVLVVVHAACAVRCSFVVLTFLFPTATYVIFFEYQTRTSTSTVCTAYDTCVACLRKIQGARDSRYSTRLLPSSHSGVDASAEHAALRGLPLRSVVSDQNAVTIATTTRPLLFFAATSSRSVISPDRNNALAVAYSESSYVG